MSQGGRDDTSNQRQTEEEMSALRNRPDGDDQTDVNPIGYVDSYGTRRTVPGDGESAFLKTPPFESDTQRCVRGAVPPFVNDPNTDYLFLPPVDVNTRRLLNFWLEWNIPIDVGAAPHRLSLIPQGKRDERDNPWYTIAVIDPTLAADTPAIGFGDRVFYQAELSTESFTGSAVVPVVFRTVLTFDVAIYTSFRIGVGSLIDESGGVTTLLDVDYSFSD
jgi:hypothetical protein